MNIFSSFLFVLSSTNFATAAAVENNSYLRHHQSSGSRVLNPSFPPYNQQCRDDAGPPFMDDEETFGAGKKYFNGKPAIAVGDGDCPDPLKAACASKPKIDAFLEGPVDCGTSGWFCRIVEQPNWPAANLISDLNFAGCNTTKGFNDDGFDQDGHCHGSDNDGAFYWWVRDHFFRGYNGRLRCCCGWDDVIDGGIVNSCDFRRLVTPTENLENCRDANEENVAPYRSGCKANNAPELNKPLIEDDSKCWEVQNFGEPEDGDENNNDGGVSGDIDDEDNDNDEVEEEVEEEDNDDKEEDNEEDDENEVSEEGDDEEGDENEISEEDDDDDDDDDDGKEEEEKDENEISEEGDDDDSEEEEKEEDGNEISEEGDDDDDDDSKEEEKEENENEISEDDNDADDDNDNGNDSDSSSNKENQEEEEEEEEEEVEDDESTCEDVKGKFGIYFRKKLVNKNCAWVGKNTKQRCKLALEKDMKTNGRDNCALTCGVCNNGDVENDNEDPVGVVTDPCDGWNKKKCRRTPGCKFVTKKNKCAKSNNPCDGFNKKKCIKKPGCKFNNKKSKCIIDKNA